MKPGTTEAALTVIGGVLLGVVSIWAACGAARLLRLLAESLK